jgi:hypothetical protein
MNPGLPPAQDVAQHGPPPLLLYSTAAEHPIVVGVLEPPCAPLDHEPGFDEVGQLHLALTKRDAGRDPHRIGARHHDRELRME